MLLEAVGCRGKESLLWEFRWRMVEVGAASAQRARNARPFCEASHAQGV